MREKILAYCIKYEGDWQRISKALASQEEIERIECKENYVTVVDKNYPERLRQLRFPPWILFYRGNLGYCSEKTLGIVGSRALSDYGRWCTEQICHTVKDSRIIVSGMAKGIDAIAHHHSMSYKTIGVLGNGLDVIYPKENANLYQEMAEKQLLLSEYPNHIAPAKHHFPWRNRIIAALSDKIVVPQARIRSGTLVTVNHAIEMGKEVYCAPTSLWDITGEGGNELIYNGANILIHFDDLI